MMPWYYSNEKDAYEVVFPVPFILSIVEYDYMLDYQYDYNDA